MLRRLIPDNIEISTRLQEDLRLVSADPSTIDQVIVNLAVNARDAMPRGGELFISTENITIGPETCATIQDSYAGTFICITISDNGTGIPSGIREKIFDPFFTTKKEQSGTGLGLSVVYGILQQHHGWINVYSEIGQGTTCKIYLPAHDKDIEETRGKTEAAAVVKGQNQNILVVEDDRDVRATTVRALDQNGYNVFEACNGDEALEFLKTSGESVSLLLSDVVMPGMNGLELARAVTAAHHDISVLLGSGHAGTDPVRKQIEEQKIPFIEKPYVIPDLLRAVHTALNHPRHEPETAVQKNQI